MRINKSSILNSILAQAPSAKIGQSMAEHLNLKYRKSPKKREYPEDDFQIECVKLLRDMKILCFSVPNHIYRGKNSNEGAFLQYMENERRKGLLRGVADIGFMFANVNGTLSMCWFECKANYNKPSVEQQEFLDTAKKCGCYTAWGKTLDDLRSLLKEAGHPAFK